MKHHVQAMLKAGSAVLMMLVVGAAGCQQPAPVVDPAQKLRPVIDRYVDAWNTGNFKDFEAIIDPHYVRHANMQPDVEGVEGLKKLIAGFRTAYPDLKITLNEDTYATDRSAARWTLTATNTGPGENPPTGKSVKVWGLAMTRYANGKLVEEWVAFDNQSFMQQLGFTMAPPAEPRTKK